MKDDFGDLPSGKLAVGVRQFHHSDIKPTGQALHVEIDPFSPWLPVTFLINSPATSYNCTFNV